METAIEHTVKATAFACRHARETLYDIIVNIDSRATPTSGNQPINLSLGLDRHLHTHAWPAWFRIMVISEIKTVVQKYVGGEATDTVGDFIKMKPRPQKASKSNRKHASSIKHANKKRSKMQKQGKLRKKSNKKAIGDNEINTKEVEKVDDHCFEEEKSDDGDVLDMIEEEDIQFLHHTKNQYTFLNTNLSNKSSQNSKLSIKSSQNSNNDKNEELEFEKIPRSYQIIQKNTRPLLPFKNKDGLILQSEEINEEEEDDSHSDMDEVTEQIVELPIKQYSAAELFAKQKQNLKSLKVKVAILCANIIEDPENNMKRLKELRLLLDKSEIGLIGFRLVLTSLFEVFKDIIPGYQILTPADYQNNKMKKETKTLVESEQALLRNYKHFLVRLEQLLPGIRGKYQKSNATDAAKKSSLILGETAVMCMCGLIEKHPHFNFRNTIISIIVPLMAHTSPSISLQCCSSIKSVFKQDKLGDVSLEVIDTFLALKLKNANLNADEKRQNILTRKEWYKKFSRRERKFKKRMSMLDQELLEADAAESRQKKTKFHTETVKLVFLCYFRILKLVSTSTLLASVLEGLAKFAHLINIDFFDDLITVLFKHMESGQLNYRESIHCVKTVFTILSGQGEALNIDPQQFYCHLYNASLSLHAGMSSDDVKLLLECINMMIIQRRKKVSFQRILAFMKRLSTICLQLHHNAVLACLSYVRSLLLIHRNSDILLDTDCSSGTGYFMPELKDPDHCCAQSTSFWELTLLNKHYHSDVRMMAKNILLGAPIQGSGSLPNELSKTNPSELFEMYSPNVFKPAIPTIKSKALKKSKVGMRETEKNGLILLNDIKMENNLFV
ncbi:Nucleolar complex protein 3 [Nymphon striatum]|nr:Nucleolar complex protein 3 [Nymphon striatum]